MPLAETVAPKFQFVLPFAAPPATRSAMLELGSALPLPPKNLRPPLVPDT